MIAGLGIGISLVMIAIGYILSIASKDQIERKRLVQGAGPKQYRRAMVKGGKKCQHFFTVS
jgi:hypothetical protein